MNTAAIAKIQRPENLPAEYAELTISDCIMLALSKNKLKPAEKKLVNDYKKLVAKEEKAIAKAEAVARAKAEKAEAVARAKAEKAEAVARAKAEKAEAVARAKAEKAEAVAQAKAEKAAKAKEARAAKAKEARAAKAKANTEENVVNDIVKTKQRRANKSQDKPVEETHADDTQTVEEKDKTNEEPIIETQTVEEKDKIKEEPIVEKPIDEHLVEEVYIEKEKPKTKVVKKPAGEKKLKNKKSTDA